MSRLVILSLLCLLCSPAVRAQEEPVPRAPNVPVQRSHPVESIDPDTLGSAAPIAPGQDAPEFRLESSTGEPIALADLRGHWVVLVFNATRTWFGPLAAAGDSLRALDARTCGICQDGATTLRDYATQVALPFPLLADPTGQLSQLFGLYDADAHAIQSGVVLIDAHGVVRLVAPGGTLHAADVLAIALRAIRNS